MARTKLFRWRAIVPLLLFLALLGMAWLLLLDRIAKRAIEAAATHVVGARVDLAGADVRLGEGALVLRGLAVTNPDAPMTNLFEADEIVADVRLLPLLEQKLAIDTVAVRGLRFGTERETSGALDEPSPESRRARQEVDGWAAAVRVPEFSLEGLGQAVDVGAVRPESLQTARRADALVQRSDALRLGWERTLATLDPQPAIDSARALLERLRGVDLGRLGPVGAAQLGNSTRSTIGRLGELTARVQSLDSIARFDLGEMEAGMRALTAAREADYAYARGLLQLPSLDAPDISPGVFGAAAVSWIQPVLYWLRLAEEYLPPGLDPRRRAGPQRPRRSGTTVEFPRQEGQPRFLLEHGEASLKLAGEGFEAGSYSALVTGLTSAPSLYGRPLRLEIGRIDAAAGPTDVRVGALLDHVAAPVRDSVDVAARGISLPDLDLPSLGARLVPGRGSAALTLERSGSEVGGELVWRATEVSWERLGAGDVAGDATRLGSRAWAEDFLWRAVSGMREVEVAVRLGGSIGAPALQVRSNVGDVIARSLQRELGHEIRRAEAEVRAQVDALVGDAAGRARAGVRGLEVMLRDEIDGPLSALEGVQADLEREVERLTRRLPGGLRIP